jgi:hypothetical protein
MKETDQIMQTLIIFHIFFASHILGHFWIKEIEEEMLALILCYNPLSAICKATA